MNAPLPVVQTGSIPALAMDENQLIQVLETSLYPGANPTSIALVINYCRASMLDPMQKPVHIVPMWDSKRKQMRDVIMPGVGLYRTQAARSGQYAGVSDPEYGPDITEEVGGVTITYPVWCKVTVKRLLDADHIVDFSATERWRENYATAGKDSLAPNAMWKKRPYGQLAKCAEAQALRKAFPELAGSQPTADEMEGKVINDEYAGTVVDNATGDVLEKPAVAMPKSKASESSESATQKDETAVTKGERMYLTKKCENLGLKLEDVAAEARITDLENMTKDGFTAIKELLAEKERA